MESIHATPKKDKRHSGHFFQLDKGLEKTAPTQMFRPFHGGMDDDTWFENITIQKLTSQHDMYAGHI